MQQNPEIQLPEIDLELIAAHILELCDACTQEHLASLIRSQADGLLRGHDNKAASNAALN